MVSRQRFSRSRDGCLQCRGRHQKCDEQKPSCSLCVARKVNCEYPSSHKWIQNDGPVVWRHKPQRSKCHSPPLGQGVLAPHFPHDTTGLENYIDKLSWEYCELEQSSFLPHQRTKQDRGLRSSDTHTVSPHLQAIDETENPYQAISIVALSFPVLLHTIICIASEHMLNSGLVGVLRAAAHKERMIRSIHCFIQKNHGQRLIEKSTTKDNEISSFLLAIMLQGVVVAHAQNDAPEPHICYAWSLMQSLKLCDNIPENMVMRMAIQRFAMMDVTVSISRQCRPQAPPNFILYRPSTHWDDSEPSFHSMTGCPQPLMCFLVQICLLANEVDEGLEQGMLADFSKAVTLNNNLQQWAAAYSGFDKPLSSRNPLDVLTECYFRTAELLLARRVFKSPPNSPIVQSLMHISFNVMEYLPAGCGADSSLPQPFYLTAREAVSTNDRDWVRKRHRETSSYYCEQQRNSAMHHIEMIWRVVDIFLENETRGETGTLGELDAQIKTLDRNSTVFIF